MPTLLPTVQRRVLLVADQPRAITDTMARLEASFLKAHKRKLAADLFLSDWTDSVVGGKRRQRYGLVAYHTAEQTDEVDWLAANVGVPEQAAVRV